MFAAPSHPYHEFAMTKVLVVDDEPAIVRLVRDYLERAGFEVTTASNGEDALQHFARNRPDLVILDLSLPGMDGLDVARAMRRSGDVPIIMLTARTEEADRVAGLELGADDYVTKPFSAREIACRSRWMGATSCSLPRSFNCFSTWLGNRGVSSREGSCSMPSTAWRWSRMSARSTRT
jgi:DNA-binding response OmpR family regulator